MEHDDIFDPLWQAIKRSLRLGDDKLRKAKDWYGHCRREGRSPFKIVNGDAEKFAYLESLFDAAETVYPPGSPPPDPEMQKFLIRLVAEYWKLQPWALPYGGLDSDQHYTPVEYINSVRKVMGSIDVDPASCHWANENLVKAPLFYHINNTGLRQGNRI